MASAETLETIAEFAASLNQVSRPIIAKHFRQKIAVEKKADATPVTIADREVEAALREAIAARFPGHAILGEEGGHTPGGGGGGENITWVIDPIDGTRAFASGNPLFGTLIAVLDGAKPVMGILDLPAVDHCWRGLTGFTTWLNSEPVQTSAVEDISQARLVTTSMIDLGDRAGDFDRLKAHTATLSYGGDCANYGHLASGWCDIVAEAQLAPHDLMALVPVVAGAGGIITRWDGEAITLDSHDGTALASASPALHDEAVKLLGA